MGPLGCIDRVPRIPRRAVCIWGSAGRNPQRLASPSIFGRKYLIQNRFTAAETETERQAEFAEFEEGRQRAEGDGLLPFVKPTVVKTKKIQ
jgi:hypothetical protein